MPQTWDESLETGVAEIDAGHRQIFELFDALLLSLVEERGDVVVAEALSKLAEVMCEHIDCEDGLMRTVVYGDAEAHRADHDGYLVGLSQLTVDYQKRSLSLASGVRELIRDWKDYHQVRFDRPLARAVLDQRRPRPVMEPEFAHRSACR